jgi:hypothetical protein
MAIVILYDIEEILVTDWARNNCSSFVGWLIYENSNAFGFTNWEDDPEWCIRYELEFTDEQEALMFRLRWQGQSHAT